MKKILLLMGAFFITGVANAQTEYYASMKLGAGDTTIYTSGNTKQGAEIENAFEALGYRYKYTDSGLLWEISPAVGIDWSFDKMYVTPYRGLHLRLEGELGYNHYSENGKLKDGYAVADTVKIKFDEMFLLANGYADFRIDKFAPYVGFGVGYAFGRQEITITGLHFNDSVDDGGVIYALHAGIAYKHSDITMLDVGYRRLYEPTEGNGLNVFSTVRLGVRFRI